MDTDNLSQETTTQNAETEQAEPKTFTQDDVNRIVAKRVEKYSDYAELKEKASKYDELSSQSYVISGDIESVETPNLSPFLITGDCTITIS